MVSQNKPDFESLFKANFNPLCGFAIKYVYNLDDAKNLVHDAFIAVWEKYDSLPEDTNFRSYLYTSVRNKCLNYLRDNKQTVPIDPNVNEPQEEQSLDIETRELEREIELAINLLPEKNRIVFEMSRYEELKYSDIAEKLNISVKTVEGRMTKALSLLRDSLSHFISILYLLLNFQGYELFFVLLG